MRYESFSGGKEESAGRLAPKISQPKNGAGGARRAVQARWAKRKAVGDRKDKHK